MAYAQLLAELRMRPGDRDHRQVFADVLLTAGDPRGELMVAQLAGQPVPAPVFQRCLARVLAAAPRATRVRFEAGLVTELELPLAAVSELDRDWLVHEPLVRIVTELPSEDAELEPALTRARAVLSACRGFGFDGSINAARWPIIRAFIDEATPSVLELDLALAFRDCRPEPSWPFVKAASLTAHVAVHEQLLDQCMPALRRLQLHGAGACLPFGLWLPELEHLDLRGEGLSENEVRQLGVWLEERPGRSIRHERFELGPPDLDDLFGDRGLVWEAAAPLVCRVAAVPGERSGFATARGTDLQFHQRDRPSWRRSVGAPITAIAGRDQAVLVGRSDGQIQAHGLGNTTVDPIVTLPGAIQTLHAAGESVAATFEGGWWLMHDGEIRQGSEQLVALVLTANGTAWAEGSRVMFSGPSGPGAGANRIVELGEPIHALASGGAQIGDQLVAIAGRGIWRIDASGPVALGVHPRGARPVIACHDRLIAWIASRTSAAILRGDALTHVSYPGTYSHSDDSELALADLCALDSGTLVTALEHGGMNLLVPGSAMKADEFAGEPHRRWVFVYEGNILIAG